jgi:pimeloyl-ACP methyl ester carboxylesterase
LILLLAGGWILVDRMGRGIPGFMVWRAMSSAAHGGDMVEVNSVRLYVETYGAGEPLLLIHGGFSTIETMHYQITDFSGHRRVIAADSRAHGRSDPIEGTLHYADMADDMVALLDHLKIARADVFGWSDGGIIALDMAMRYPTRVGKIAVFGSNFHHNGLIDSEVNPLDEGPDGESMAPMRFLYQSVAQDPDRWPLFFEKTITMWTTEPTHTEAALAAIDAPVLIMAGEHDMIKPDHLAAMERAIPNARIEILPGDDHFAPMQNPEAVNALLTDFLDG